MAGAGGFLVSCERGWANVVEEMARDPVPHEQGLMIAIAAGHVDIVRALMPYCRGQEDAAFATACSSRQWGVAHFLLETAASDIRPSVQDIAHMVCVGGSVSVLAKALPRFRGTLPEHIVVDAMRATRDQFLQVLRHSPHLADAIVFDDMVPLLVAVYYGIDWAVDALLDTGRVDIHRLDPRIQRSAIQVAVMSAQWHIAIKLAKAGAEGLDPLFLLENDDPGLADVLKDAASPRIILDLPAFLGHAARHNMGRCVAWALERTAPTALVLERAVGTRAHDAVRLLLADKRTPCPVNGAVDPLSIIPGAPLDRMLAKAAFAGYGARRRRRKNDCKPAVLEYVLERASTDVRRALSELLC